MITASVPQCLSAPGTEPIAFSPLWQIITTILWASCGTEEEVVHKATIWCPTHPSDSQQPKCLWAQGANIRTPSLYFTIKVQLGPALNEGFDDSFKEEKDGDWGSLYHHPFHSICSDCYLSDFKCNALSRAHLKYFMANITLSLSK
jgi:hypothetical protein